ncbi:MAG: HDIG domain-containing protein [Desulfovibrionaceae bacterium]|nr:HDIG domain-containing protein [Desulfovibrionaceae bacterium]
MWMTRQEALDLLSSKNPEPNLLTHCLESEAIMRGLAQRLGQDQDLWGLVGLLHDLDYPETRDRPEGHGLEAARELAARLPEEALRAIRAHAFELNGLDAPESELDFALRCAESVTGLVHANALVRPQGLAGMKPKSLKKKMKEKAFAANVNRDMILECQRLGLEPDDLFQIAIQAMTNIAAQIGLA